MRRLLVLAMALLVLTGCEPDESAGPLRTQTLDVGPFDRIDVNARTSMTIRVGARPSVVLRGDEKLLEEVDAKVRDGTLTIDAGDREGDLLTVTVTVSELRAVTAKGAGEIDVVGVKGEALELRNEGVARVQVRGRVDMLAAYVGGVGELPLYDLMTRRALVEVTGVGTAYVHATDELHVRMDGVGRVRYRGNPTVRKVGGGAGDVRRAES